MTDRAREAARIESELGRFVGTTAETVQAAKRLVALGVRYQDIQERWCNEPMTKAAHARTHAAEARIEEDVIAIVEHLPQPTVDDVNGCIWAVRFDGDPCGPVIRLTAMLRHEQVAELPQSRTVVIA